MPLDDIEFLFSIYNERDRRLFAGFLARSIGCGGIQKAVRLTGLDAKTVRKGVKELNERDANQDSRIRCKGGGRRAKSESEAEYELELLRLIEDDLAGDPMKERKWVRKTLRWMGKKLGEKGINVSLGTIWNTLKEHGISLKKNKKSKSTQDHPKRDEQFQMLSKLKRLFLDSGKPVISVDCKKKELIGNFKNDGRTWRKKAIEVFDHDFPNLGMGKLVPYGIYDLQNNQGHVYCGISSETSEFAVDCICRWWEEYGQFAYPGQCKLLILCDSGGSNGYRRSMETGSPDQAGRLFWARGLRLPLSAGSLEVQPDRAKAVLLHFQELGGRTVNQLRESIELHQVDYDGDRVESECRAR